MSNDNKKSNDDRDKDNADKAPPSILMWAVRGVSALLVVGLLGYLIWSAVQPTVEVRFAFEVKTEDCAQREGRWVLPVEVTNESTISAHDVTYAISLSDGTEKMVTLLLIGPNEQLTHEFWFDEDPRGRAAKCQVTSYLLP